ncbi:hypothetical protein [Lacinutrix algicola]|uniref:hypothetical protein n=1 Tax=Lacinutrix algicola TaxID=342954 RepID=UPI0006E1C238|nr:hypothetical protein [Lacinutrix algicola]
MFTNKETNNKQIDLAYFNNRLTKEYDYLKKYFELNRQSVLDNQTRLQDELFEDTNRDPDNESMIQDIFETSLNTITSLYYHSSIALVHSFLEEHLSKICFLIQKETNHKFSLENLKGGDYIKNSFEYLMLTSALNVELVNRHKPRLKKFQILRNKIIHENSKYKNSDEKEKLINDFNDKIGFIESENKFYLKTDDLQLEYLEKSKKVLDDVLSDIIQKSFLVLG